MSNYEKLKELAEATKGWDNLKSCWPEETEDGDLEVNWFVGAVTEDDDKYPVLEVNTAQYDAFEDAGRLARYYAAANPAAVLALIAENERLKTLRSITERDLAQELEVWRHGPSCWSCGDTGDVHDMVGEWRGQCDCNAAKLIDVSSERDQLKSEVAGLKTGYEAYEQVNAQLKAENEALRANSSLSVLLPELDSALEDLELHGQHSDQGYRKLKDWYRKVDLACKAIDAAIGKAVQP